MCIWFSILDTYTPPGSMVLFSGGKLLLGLGNGQREKEVFDETTVGSLREKWGMQDEFAVWPADMKAYVYTDDTENGDGANSLTAVFVDLPL